ncbi:putative flippase GtrA [Parabacteroides sp. PFB2-10]|uniref:GtrA family protein n=1 Tax=Parabacteroides sp. PFB2-10 TaxID=1742405 RepID=UPI0024732930|nr:GtrA family protein [Parabacteroides sp. PFB2-10]MDH6312965.1 putative flippase GtrA [Parabacteroides sp. PFB2-10]MDL2245023.1 GtrA family protein [Parabacteroides sp. OttesenSCG-928-J18]
MKVLIEKIIGWFYFPIFRKFIPYDTFKYAVCGGGNMVLDILLYFLLYNFIFDKQNLDLGFVTISPHIAAFLTVFPITFLTGFWLNNGVVFKGSPMKNSTKFSRYLLVVLTSLLINYWGLKFFVDYLHFYPTPSKFLVTIICTLVSYLSQRHFTFRHYERSEFSEK